MQSLIKVIVLFFIAVVVIGCQSVPYSDRSRLLLTSESSENKMGLTAWDEICKKTPVSNNKNYNNALLRVGQALIKVVDKPSFKWEFKVFKDKTPNAFCLPGGKVAVHTGLFEYTANDAELAAVVGHEIGHAIARHGGERMSQAQLQNIGQQLVRASVSSEQQGSVLLAYGALANVGFVLPYSRTHEYEADKLGMIFLAKAGYHPNGALSFWSKFSKLSKISSMQEFLSTHPMGSKRLRKIEDFYPTAMKYYNMSEKKKGIGFLIKP